jgi:hypothetical protein
LPGASRLWPESGDGDDVDSVASPGREDVRASEHGKEGWLPYGVKIDGAGELEQRFRALVYCSA